MPYIFDKTAKKKSPYYKNIIDADKEKQLRKALDEKKRMEISGSIVDATNPIRDESGFLLSYESPEKRGQSIEEDYQLVRLQVRQNSGTTDRVVKFFGNDIQFLEIFPRENEEEETGVDINALQEELDGEIERTQTLNNGLTDAINTLNKKIAELNDTTSTDQEKKEVKKKPKKKKKKKGGKLKKALKKIFSDERLKRDIVPLGIENGFNTYGFRYIWGTQRYKGVMAQEVMETNPQAVGKVLGLYMVDYNEIGVEFGKC
tara:strand:- start:11414 stop:12193 length:780 start_codon:yes stop_codon:yes gene_type:complete